MRQLAEVYTNWVIGGIIVWGMFMAWVIAFLPHHHPWEWPKWTGRPDTYEDQDAYKGKLMLGGFALLLFYEAAIKVIFTYN